MSPRYGAEIHGGAETGIRGLASHLAAAGHSVEVHSTTAADMATWADVLPEGTTTDDGVVVHRHRTTQERSRGFDRLSTRALADPASIDPQLEARWIQEQGPHSPDLLDAISSLVADVVVMSPYLYEPTLLGAGRANCPLVIHPASHDEAPLRLPAVRRAIEVADGLGFYTDAERRLTERIIPGARLTRQMRVGLGVDTERLPVEFRSQAIERAREQLDLGDDPFFVVLGRVDRGKGTHSLISMFEQLRRSGVITHQLVIAGPVVERPAAADGVVVTGSIDDEVRHGLLAGATGLISPSVMESFSLVVLESWIAGTPVIVHAGCAATVEHVRESKGGLTYRDIDDLQRALSLLASFPDQANRLADRGRRYVEQWFTWPAILARYVPFLTRVAAHGGEKHRYRSA